MATKAELEQQVTELQSQLAAAQSAPDAAPRLPGLAERIWLPKSLDEEFEGANGTFKAVKQGKTPNGKEWLSFKAQVAHLDDDTNVRTYSKHRFTFKAWNENRQLIMDLIEANDRLVDITANYVPDVYTNRDGIDVQIDNYLILSINPVKRTNS